MTQHILSLSYGKDSLACIEACKQLGYPIDRIIHAEVWATDTIPADLPPMVEFKKYADKIIKERYGLTVEHVCAMRKRERKKECLTTDSSTLRDSINCSTENVSTDSQCRESLGATTDLKSKSSTLLQSSEKLTYERLFYHVPKRRNSRERERERERRLATTRERLWSKLTTQNASDTKGQSSDFQWQKGLGATAVSSSLVYGFPMSIGRGNWCTKLKTSVFR